MAKARQSLYVNQERLKPSALGRRYYERVFEREPAQPFEEIQIPIENHRDTESTEVLWQ
jgi:hypothetical protein